MLHLCLATALLASAPDSQHSELSTQDLPLRDAVRELARAYPRSSHTEPPAEIVLRMVAVHHALSRDTQLPRPNRDRLQREIAGRLKQAAASIQRRLARQEKEQHKSTLRSSAADTSSANNAIVPESLTPPADRSSVLAQPAGRPPAGGQGAIGPPRQRGSGVLGNAALPDNGPALVALIQRTISPGTWDVNGGEGTVQYYRPLRVLVIRAPSAVHDNVGGVLGGLRK
jgi:hypothetical protein